MCTLATAILCVHIGKAVSLWPSIRNNIREQFRCAFCCSYPWVSSNIIVTSSQNVGNPYLLKDIDLNNLSSTYVKWMKSQRYCVPPTSTINARNRQAITICHLSSSPDTVWTRLLAVLGSNPHLEQMLGRVCPICGHAKPPRYANEYQTEINL